MTARPVDLGRAGAEVHAALTRLGLLPRLAYDGDGRAVGTVSDVEPAGQLVVGSAPVVHAVPAAPPGAVGKGEGRR